ncbi:hypothetical protein L1987_88173 [Smallanthus sonchifolius]|nr:hypothetical protein L1987_88173 [Smallanthus sonchifolius]
MAVAHRYSVRDFRLLCRLGGAGYRVLARLDHRRPRRYSRLVVMGLKLLSPSYPLDFWLGPQPVVDAPPELSLTCDIPELSILDLSRRVLPTLPS